MATHATQTLQEEGAGGFTGSILLHVAIAGLIVAWAMLGHSRDQHWGQNASSAGAIQASIVSAIPLPPTQQVLDKAVLASDTPSPAPVTAKEITQPPPKPDEVPVPVKKLVTKVAAKPTPVAVTHPSPIPVPLTKATTGATPGINLPQSLTLKLQNGTASITMQDQAFGSRYAYYVDIISKKVAQNWRSQEADPGSSNGKRVTLLFDIARDGTPNTIRVETRSGSPSLDTSALRALQRVDGFGPLPGSADHVTVEYSFDYRQQ